LNRFVTSAPSTAAASTAAFWTGSSSLKRRVAASS
jgi:hypothetical protein